VVGKVDIEPAFEAAGGAVLRRIPVPRNNDSRAEKHAARSRHSFSNDRRSSRRRKSCSVWAAATLATTVACNDGNEYIGGHGNLMLAKQDRQYLPLFQGLRCLKVPPHRSHTGSRAAAWCGRSGIQWVPMWLSDEQPAGIRAPIEWREWLMAEGGWGVVGNRWTSGDRLTLLRRLHVDLCGRVVECRASQCPKDRPYFHEAGPGNHSQFRGFPSNTLHHS